MKTNSFFKSIALIAIFSLASCSRDNGTTTTDTKLTGADVTANNKIDKASNDIADIAEDQYLQLPGAYRLSNAYTTILPSCATSVATVTSTSWTRTVTFNNCVFNGNTLTGQIIVSGSLPLPNVATMATTGYTINYQFVNFTHNGIVFSGDRNITRKFASSSLLSTNHPIHIMDINMTATFPNGDVYTRVGSRTRECVANFGDGNLWNNKYNFYQNITNTRPNGAQHVYSISVNNPLVVDMSCQYRVTGGVLTITGPSHSAVLNYGTGACDNSATYSIDGGTPVPFTF